jgi:hypothetical protein
MIRARALLVAATAALAALSPLPAHAQTARGSASNADATSAGPPLLDAVRLTGGEPTIDGRLDDAAWEQAPIARDFVQFEPAEGEPATERTEARVLYGPDAIFVAIRAFESAPDSIAGQLTRRDQWSYSDQVAVLIDSYFDRRTAFQFAVNPVGVKTDIYHFDDTNENWNWDAVWDVATALDGEGWSAEFRIPYSQLRFRAGSEQTWGVNFVRKIARRGEQAVWAPTRRSESAIVSRFGELRGMTDIAPPRRLEIVPYSLAKLDRAPGKPEDPFWSANALGGALGGDLKYGVTSNLTLDVTINPDFGQVEADPSQVNLTAYETFLPERRPFFVEGGNLFSFGLGFGDGGWGEGLFYSRRIGRPPQGSADAGDGGHKHTPSESTILGAAKLSGKTAAGWSIGVLNAVTAQESAEVAPAIGARRNVVVEPLTNYLVTRLSRDFRNGKSAVGAIATSVARDGDVATALELRSTAFSGGVDTRHRFDEDRWELQAFLLGTRIHGSERTITKAQRSSARYFQRPDADHTVLDTTRTSLSGSSFGVNLSKIAGGHWRLGTGLTVRTPGFEPNDAGFMSETDAISPFFYLGYDQSSPQGPFRRYRLNLNAWDGWTTGWEHYGGGGNINGNFQLQSYWGGYGGINYNGVGVNTAVLRGGPAYLKEPNWNWWYGFNSDDRKSVRFFFNGWGNARFASESWNYGLGPEVSWRPSTRAQISVGGNYSKNLEDVQWIERVGSGDAARYVFGRMDQSTVGVTTRMDLAFTPTLTLQVYAQPFVSGGEYTDLKRITDPRAERYEDRFAPIQARLEGDRYFADLDGNGSEESFKKPDFNSRQFNSNVVLRWEYQPGSALFVVWAQGRENSTRTGSFDLDGDLNDLFSTRPRDVFMVKLSYWLNP